MNDPSADLIGRLDRLIRLCKEASYEYNLAANRARDESVHAALEEAVGRHAIIARELEERINAWHVRDEVGLIPAVPEEGFWSELNKAATAGDDAAMVEVCERGERQLLAAFVSTVAEPEMIPEAAALLRQQTETLSESHRKLEELCERVSGHKRSAG